MITMLSQASIVALLSLLVGILPLGFGIAYAFKPTEQRLELLRPLSLAGIFGGLTGAMSGFINVLRGVWMEPPVDTRVLAIGAAESLVALLVSFGALTVAWLCVAIGLRRQA